MEIKSAVCRESFFHVVAEQAPRVCKRGRQHLSSLHPAFFYQRTAYDRGAACGQLPVGRESPSELYSYRHVVGVPLDPALLVGHLLQNVTDLLENLETGRLHLALT